MPGVQSRVAEAKKQIADLGQGNPEKKLDEGLLDENQAPPGDQNNLKPEDQLPEAEPFKKPDEDGGSSDNFKQKYDVLQSKYDKEVPRLHEDLKSLRATIAGLESTVENQNLLIEEMAKQKPSDTPTGEAGSDPTGTRVAKYSKLNPEDFADYDDGIKGIINTVNGVIEEADLLRADNERLTKENESLKNDFTSVKDTAATTANTVNKTTRDNFWRTVSAAAPNFAKYNGENGENADPKWANFLNSYDQNMVQYRSMAMDAINNLNPEVLIQVVNDFESQVSGKKVPSKDAGQAGLEDQATLGRGAGDPGGGSGSNEFVPVSEADMATARKMLRNKEITPDQFRKIVDRRHQTITGQGKK